MNSDLAFLKGYLRRLGLKPADAEDLVQETVLRLLELPVHRQLTSTRAFAIAIARNLAIDLKRSAHVRLVQTIADTTSLGGVSWLDPERHATAADELADLSRAVSRLPRRQHEVFLRRRVDGASLKEIARTLGIGVSAVEQYLTLALRRVRAAVRPSDCI